jgi:DNA-binding MarR family transcriptional regulator
MMVLIGDNGRARFRRAAVKRIKLVILTRKGQKIRTELLDEFHRPPAEFDALDRVDLEALERALAKMTRTPQIL